MPVTIDALAERLKDLGCMIVPHGDHFGIRLSLYTSVRVRITDGRLALEPRFGPFHRVHATLLKTLGLSVVAVFSLLAGSQLPASFAIVFVALALWGYDALRYTLTESCLTQVRHAFGALLDATPAEHVPRELRPGDPPIVMRDERVRVRAE